MDVPKHKPLPPPPRTVTGMRMPPRARLTGAIRFRRGWFGRLVVQVEVEINPAGPMPGGGYQPGAVRLVWRDAHRGELDEVMRCGVFKPSMRLPARSEKVRGSSPPPPR